jgi:hypothetical protein
MSSQSPEILNLLEWESQCALSPSEANFLKKFEALRVSPPAISSKKPSLISSENRLSSLISPENSRILTWEEPIEESLLNKLTRAKQFNEALLRRIEEMKEFLDDYKGNVLQLKELKENLTGKINTLYNSSARIIEQQKNLMETNNLIKAYLQYYTEVARIEKEIEGISLNLAKKEIFEGE